MNDKKLRILFLNLVQELGGAERSLLDILAHIDRGKFHILLASAGNGPLLGRAREMGIEVRSLEIPERVLNWRMEQATAGMQTALFGALASVATIFRLHRLLRSEGIDILYTNNQKAHVIGGLAGKLAGVPVIWHFRDIMEKPRLRRLVDLLGLWLPSRIIAVSNAVAGQFHLPSVKNKISVIHNGIDIDSVRKKSQAQRPENVRRQYRVPAGAPLVGMVGRIAPRKGQHLFIEAARLIAAELTSARFMIAGGALFGEQAYLLEVQELARRRGLEGKLHFTGQLENAYPIMAALDTMVLCSVEPEGFGRSVAEAMALGVPVAASRLGAVPEIIDDGRDGLLAEPADARGLAQAALRILKEPGLSRRLRANGRRKIERDFTLQRPIRRIESLLLGLSTI